MPAVYPITVFSPGTEVFMVKVIRAYDADTDDGRLVGVHVPLVNGDTKRVQVDAQWVFYHHHNTLLTPMRIVKRIPLTVRHPFRDETYAVHAGHGISGKVVEPTEVGLLYSNLTVTPDGRAKGRVNDCRGSVVGVEGPIQSIVHTMQDRHYLPVKMLITMGSERVVELPPDATAVSRRLIHHTLHLYPIQRKLGEFLHPVVRVDMSATGDWADRIEVVAILPKYQAAVLEAERLTQMNAGTSNIYLAKSARRTVSEGK